MKYLVLLFMSATAMAQTPLNSITLQPGTTSALLKTFGHDPRMIGGGHQGNYFYQVDVECVSNFGSAPYACYYRPPGAFSQRLFAPERLQVGGFVDEVLAHFGMDNLIWDSVFGAELQLVCSYATTGGDEDPIVSSDCKLTGVQ